MYKPISATKNFFKNIKYINICSLQMIWYNFYVYSNIYASTQEWNENKRLEKGVSNYCYYNFHSTIVLTTTDDDDKGR